MSKFSPVCKQFFAIACCNLITFSLGIATGWATINLVELQNKNSTFPTGPLTIQESSLVVSIFNVGGLIGNFAAVPITQTIGIKGSIHFLALPLILSAVLIIWAQNVYFLYVSRILIGFVAGGLVISLMSFVNSISNANIRGALNSLYDPFCNTGIIISFLLGNYLNCVDQAKIQLIVPTIFMFCAFFLPESPEFLMKKNKEKRSIKSHRFYKGSNAALEMIEFISKSKTDQIEKEMSKSSINESEAKSKLSFKDFCSPHARRAFFIAFTGIVLSFLTGIIILMGYVTDIFYRSGSSLSEKNSSILVSITQIIANLVLLNIVERVNRKTLYIGSSLLTAISYFMFAVYCLFFQSNPEYKWMPPFCVASMIYFSWLGLVPMPWIIMNEIFPKKIHQTCLAIVVSSMWIILFILGNFFLPFLETFGLANSMITLGVMCLLNAFFCIFCIPETRGKTFEEIADMFSG